MAMALIDGRIGGQAIKVFVAVGIPQPDAPAARQHDIERLVIVRPELVLNGDIVLGII